MRENEKQPIRTRRVVLIVVFVVLLMILVLLVGALIWGKILLSRINRLDGTVDTVSSEEAESIRRETDPINPSFTGPNIDSSDVTMPTRPADQVVVEDNIINILLVGQDKVSGTRRMRSDSMILCTIDKKNKTLTMTSFMRDLWVRIPGYYDERLNVPYYLGGFPLLNSTLEYQFGVSADRNIEVDFSGFTKIIDKIGGIDINLTTAEANYLNKCFDWHLTAGVHHLNGTAALTYARNRSTDNDFKRTNRQRNVINAVFEKVRYMNSSELYSLIMELLPLLTTDMTDTDILNYLLELAPILPDMKVVSQRIPADNAYSFARIDGKEVLLMSPSDLEKNKQLLHTAMGIE